MLAACVLCRGCGHDLELGFFRFWAELWWDPFPVGGRLFSASRASCISWLVSHLLSSFWPAVVGHILLSPQDSPPLLASPCLSCPILSPEVCDSLNVGPSWKVQAISLAQGQLLPITSSQLSSAHHLISSFPSQKSECTLHPDFFCMVSLQL